MKTLLLPLSLAIASCCWSQLSDDFSDGNFTANPVWSGTTADYVINSGEALQVNNTVAATSYLSAPHGLSNLNDVEWRFWIRQSFSGSASNFGRIYLTSDEADLTGSPNGFFLQLGESGSQDAIRLNKYVNGTVTEICAGSAAQIAASFSISIRVVRNNSGEWSLYTDPAGGTDFVLNATGTDATPLTGTHFGLLATYTVSNATKFFYDNIYVGGEIIDSQVPAIVSATSVSPAQVDVLFNETVTNPDASNPGNYSLNPAVIVSNAAIDATNHALIHLTLGEELINGQNYQLSVASIADLSGNTASNLSATFIFLESDTPEKGDLIITEFFADPTPVIGLPEAEFIEIYNHSNKYFDLSGWKVGDASADGTITGGWIMPGEYKILCATTSQSLYAGSFAATSFPSLNNSGDNIVLKSPNGLIIDKLSYTDEWYNDELKQEGGYTLELITINDPCSDQLNWGASNSFSGGTPGIQNSIYDSSPDVTVPKLTATLAIVPDRLELLFSEGMDSTSLANSVISIDPALNVLEYVIPSGSRQTMAITFEEAITPSQPYLFTIGPVSDCWLNTAEISGSFALAENPAPGDIVINEILFDPSSGGSDFVELYNRSSKVLDLLDYGLANYEDSIANKHSIQEHYLLFPDSYVVLTADTEFVKTHFYQSVPGAFIQMALPSYNNDSSTVFLFYDTLLLDHVSYTEDWHLALIDETENKTLERIDPAGISSYSGNWHTAAETIGFGTPGTQNSQYQVGGVNGSFGVVNPIFSPDNDGFEDILQFFFTMPQPGMIGTLKIFDDQGRIIHNVFKSELLGLQGNYSWDGVNDDQQKASIGIYMAVIEVFSTDGSVNFSKRVPFTLAGKLD